MNNARGILIASFQVTASSTNVPSSAGDPLELEDVLPDDIKMIEIVNDLGGPTELLIGPNANLDRVCIIPGYSSTVVHQQPRECLISKGMRLSVRNLAAAAISTGTLTINCWG